MNTIAGIGLLLIFAVSLVLIFWCKYHEGVFGNIALSLAGGASGLFLYDWLVLRSAYEFTPLGALLFLGTGAFMLRHALCAIYYIQFKNKGDANGQSKAVPPAVD